MIVIDNIIIYSFLNPNLLEQLYIWVDYKSIDINSLKIKGTQIAIIMNNLCTAFFNVMKLILCVAILTNRTPVQHFALSSFAILFHIYFLLHIPVTQREKNQTSGSRYNFCQRVFAVCFAFAKSVFLFLLFKHLIVKMHANTFAR